jgi:hypothetical protein
MAELEEKLTEAANTLEAYKVQQQSSLSILQQKLVAREEKRRGLFEQVSHDNADSGALQQLNAVEEAIDLTKDELAQLRRESDEELRRMRREISELRITAEDEMKLELAKMRKELERLRRERIPQTEQLLSELQEREKNLDSSILILSSQLSQLQKSHHDTADLETPFF